jgi:hypothetical protein
VRPDFPEPAEAEGQGSRVDIAMRGVIQKLLATEINMKKNTQENKNISFRRLEGSRIKKRGFWACFSNKTKKKMGKSFCRLKGSA